MRLMHRILVKFGLRKGKKAKVFKSNFLSDDPKLKKYKIGKYSYGHPIVVDFNQGSTLEIGHYCSIARNVTLMLGGEHSYKNISSFPFKTIKREWTDHIFPFTDDFVESEKSDAFSKGNIIIGSDVWIGRNAMILSGVEVGHGAVIGAGTLVTKDVPPYAIVVGNPAKIINYRFKEEEIKVLLETAWWTWSVEKIDKYKNILLQGDVKKLEGVYE